MPSPGSIIRHIAAEVGVTERSVLRILGGQAPQRQGAAMQRADRIRALATELGYQPSSAARAIVRGTHQAIGVLCGIGQFSGPLGDAFTRGLLHALLGTDWRLLLSAYDDDTLTQGDSLPHLLTEWAVDGVLINYHSGFPASFASAVDRFLPASIWHNALRPWDAIAPADRDAVCTAVATLAERGHRHLAYLDCWYTSDDRDGRLHDSNRERLAGFTAGLTAHGLTGCSILDLIPDQAAWDHLLAGATPPTGLIVTSTGVAFELERQLWRHGYTIPQQRSILVLGDCDSHAGYSGLGIPQQAIGTQAIAMVRRKIAEPQRRLRRVMVPFVPVTGCSLGPPG
ncbi:MAG: LacI family DNA-binding transcriptional regulator [Planctomycetota bacterium]|jgi:DNA-binding LacI/PurR family transcriptional regulator|nr:LacI family DNA-binding transcriptional regulator [Planctomycetota bacterium]